MSGSRFTEDETVACAYAALYDAEDFGGYQLITKLTGRPVSSILAKIRNIAGTLDRFGVSRNMTWQPLTGTPPGQPARKTDWADIIEPWTRQSRESMLARCRTILGS
jgi:hypothetical protein